MSMHTCVRAYSPHSPHHTGHIENDKRRVVELFEDLGQFAANEYWLDSCLHLYAEILELLLNITCRFLIFKGYDHKNKFSWFFGSVRATYQRFLIVTSSYNAKLGKTLKYAKRSHRSSTSNASFIVFNVTCAICGLCGLYARTITQTCGYMDINKIHLQYINTTTNSTANSRKTS